MAQNEIRILAFIQEKQGISRLFSRGTAGREPSSRPYKWSQYLAFMSFISVSSPASLRLLNPVSRMETCKYFLVVPRWSCHVEASEQQYPGEAPHGSEAERRNIERNPRTRLANPRTNAELTYACACSSIGGKLET